MSLSRRSWGAVRLIAGLGLLAIVVARTGAMRLVPQLGAAPWLLVVFVIQAGLGLLLEAFRLRLLLRSQAIELAYARALWVCVTAVPFGYIVPGGVGGDVMKVASLTGTREGRGVELAAVVLVDRIIGLASLLIVALGAAVLVGSLGSAPVALRGAALAAALGVLALAGGAIVVWSPVIRAGGFYRFATTRLPLHRVLERLADAFYAFRDHRGAIGVALLFTMVGHALLAWFFILGAGVVMDAVPAGTVAWVGLLALVANVLPLTPGGLGVGEAAFEAAFASMGYKGGAQLLLLMRIGVVPFAALGAILYSVGHGSMMRPPTAESAERG